MRAFVYLCVAAMLCLVPASAFAQSDDDRGYIQGLLEDALSAEGREVRLEGFRGALSSTAEIDRIVITDPDGIWLTAENVQMQWRRAALLRGRIEIEEISIARIDLPRPPLPAPNDLPSPEAPGPFTLPELPVSINLGALRIDQASLGAPVLGEAVVLRLEGAAQLAGGEGSVTLEVDRQDRPGTFDLSGSFENVTRRLVLALDASEPAGGLVAERLSIPDSPALDLTLSGDGPLSDFGADLALATDGVDRLTGRVTLLAVPGATPEDPQSQRFTADLSGDIRPLLEPLYHDFLGEDVALRVSGEQASTGALSLSELDLTAQALRMTGSASLAPDGWPDAFNLDIALTPPRGTSVILPLLGSPTSLAGLDLTARYASEEGNRWTLDGQMQGFGQADLALETVTLSGTGQIDRGGTAVDGLIDLVARGLSFTDAALQNAVGSNLTGQVAFAWGQGAPLELTGLDFAGEDYGLTGAVTIAGIADALGVTVSPDLSLQAADLARFAQVAGIALDGAADVAIAGEVTPLSGAFDVAITGNTRDLALGIAQVDPLLAGRGQLDLAARRDNAGLRVPRLRVTTDQAAIRGTADVASGVTDANIALDLRETALVLPEVRGPAQLALTAQGRGSVWQIDGSGNAPGDTTLQITGQIETDADSAAESTARITGAVGRLATYAPVAGRPLDGSVRFVATAAGRISDPSGTLDLQVQSQDLRTGTAEADAVLRGAGQIDLLAGRAPDGTLTVQNLAVATPQITLNGDGQFGGDGPGTARIETRLANLGIIVPDLPGAATLQATARENGTGWQIDADATGPGGITVRSDGLVASDASRVDLTVTGQAPLALANSRLSGQSLDGTLAFDLAVQGAPGLDALSGQVTLADTRFSAPGLQLTLEDIRGRIGLNGGRALVEVAGQFADGGTLQVAGPIGLTPPLRADLVVTLRDAILRQAELLETQANGQVTLSGPLTGGAEVAGQISLAPVEITIPNIGPSYSSLGGLSHENLPADVRQTLLNAKLLGQTESAPAPGFPIDLTVSAPSRIFVRGRGLDAELGGEVRLTGRTDDLVPIGQFDLIRGRLELLGRNVVLDEGSIGLQGSFDPVISFSASSDIEDVLVTIGIEGPASSPEPSFTSSPELPEDEVLSLFLFGRSVEEISALQAVRLAAALRTLSGQGGLGIVSGLREGLGIDNLDIGTDDDGNAQAAIGAYISDNIYTDVTVNTQGESQIQLNLELTNQITVRGRTTSEGESALGVFFERDY